VTNRTCNVDECDRAHFGLGMCSRHYNRFAGLRRRDPARWAEFRAEMDRQKAARKAAIASPVKTCSKCKQEQPKSEFTTAPRSPDGRHAWCKACLRDLANGNYDSERARRRHAENKSDPAYVAMKKAAYVAMKKAAYDRWRREHPDRMKAANTKWRLANPERMAENARIWRKANKGLVRQWSNDYRRRRRAQKLRTSVGKVDYRVILERDGMWCYLCRTDIPSTANLHMDHVVPLARGGGHVTENIRPAHARCNLRKTDKLLSELDWYVGD
jgi:5-methylcytosine-specific restriction endonuclease McrA